MNVVYIGKMGDAINNLFALTKIVSKVVVVNTDFSYFYDEVDGMQQTIGKDCRILNLYKSGSYIEKKIPLWLRKLWRYFMCVFWDALFINS